MVWMVGTDLKCSTMNTLEVRIEPLLHLIAIDCEWLLQPMTIAAIAYFHQLRRSLPQQKSNNTKWNESTRAKSKENTTTR